jgi:hypothetical protein
VITLVREVAALARPYGVLRPAQENSDLSDVDLSIRLTQSPPPK